MTEDRPDDAISAAAWRLVHETPGVLAVVVVALAPDQPTPGIVDLMVGNAVCETRCEAEGLTLSALADTLGRNAGRFAVAAARGDALRTLRN